MEKKYAIGIYLMWRKKVEVVIIMSSPVFPLSSILSTEEKNQTARIQKTADEEAKIIEKNKPKAVRLTRNTPVVPSVPAVPARDVIYVRKGNRGKKRKKGNKGRGTRDPE